MEHRRETLRERTIPIAVAAIAGPTDEASDLLESRPALVFEAGREPAARTAFVDKAIGSPREGT
jgi:hypothetical protein